MLRSSELRRRKHIKRDALGMGHATSGMRKGGRGDTKVLIHVPKRNYLVLFKMSLGIMRTPSCCSCWPPDEILRSVAGPYLIAPHGFSFNNSENLGWVYHLYLGSRIETYYFL